MYEVSDRQKKMRNKANYYYLVPSISNLEIYVCVTLH